VSGNAKFLHYARKRYTEEMKFALFSDIHSELASLEAVIGDAKKRGCERLICLGDIGSNECTTLLREEHVVCAFGNWEVSRYHYLNPENRHWMMNQPVSLQISDFIAAHTLPVASNNLRTIGDFMKQKLQGVQWNKLFPYIRNTDNTLTEAFKLIRTSHARLLFHGHTHEQRLWEMNAGGEMVARHELLVSLQPGSLYVVGIGSVGEDEDLALPSYVTYDDDRGELEFIRLQIPREQHAAHAV
jgi:predicted phosphodiesterase